MKIVVFFTLMGFASSQVILTGFTAYLRFSNPTGAPGKVGYVPPHLPVDFFTLCGIIDLACVSVGLAIGLLRRRSEMQIKPIWFAALFIALLALGLLYANLGRNMWMSVG